MMNSLVENNEASQLRGSVALVYNLGENRNSDANNMHGAAFSQLRGIPVRFDCIHYIYDTDETQSAMKASLSGSDDRTQVRFKLHYGESWDDCKLSLLSVGLPVSIIPVEGQEDYDHYHRQWIKEQLIREQGPQKIAPKEESDTSYHEAGRDTITNTLPRPTHPDKALNTEAILIPSPMDVLLGKTKFAKEHSGNMFYWAMLEEKFDEYQQADKTTKTVISEYIMDHISSRGGRFLRKEDHGWVEIKTLDARNKVANAFRDIKKRYQREKDTGSSSAKSKVKQNPKRSRS